MVALIVLTVFSSCTVRKAIQTQWDVPITQQLNPSKTILSGGASCSAADLILLTDQSQRIGFEHSDFFIPFFSDYRLVLSEIINAPLRATSDARVIADKVPIYILYKQMKFWV